MSPSRDTEQFISELIDLIAMQEKEINRLNATINRVKQYVEVYEAYIEGRDSKWRQ